MAAKSSRMNAFLRWFYNGGYMHLKKTIYLLLTSFLFLSTPAFADQDGDYTYTVSGGKATITGYTGAGGAVSIPATLGGYPVVAIAANAFYFNSTLTSVIIPDSVTSIGMYAFYLCTSLTSVSIPASVYSIGINTFSVCTCLTGITVAAGNTNYSSQDGVLYDFAKATLIQFPGGKTGDFIIPDGVTSIRSQAFQSSAALTGVTIPASVVSIGDTAFSYCFALTAITVAAGNANFSSQDGVLYNIDKTQLIQYPGDKNGAFSIPAGVLSIGNYAFAGNGDLTAVTFPDSVTDIGMYSFSSCTGLTSVSMPASVTGIAGWAFFGCSRLTGAYFYGNAPVMGSYAFYSCAVGFTVYYIAGSTGFTSPWCPYADDQCYPAVVFDPTATTTTTAPTTTSVLPTTSTSEPPTTTVLPTTTTFEPPTTSVLPETTTSEPSTTTTLPDSTTSEMVTTTMQPATTTTIRHHSGGGGYIKTTTTTVPATTTTMQPEPTTTVPDDTTTTTTVNTTTSITECAIQNIEPEEIRIWLGLLPRIRKVAITSNTDLEAAGITCADLTIQDAPPGMKIMSCSVASDTVEAVILFWGVQPGTYSLRIGGCGSVRFAVVRF
jgi:hypothetical protein